MADPTRPGTHEDTDALPAESPLRALLVVGVVALVCSALVSAAVVQLRPLQEANLAAARQARLEAMLAALPGMEQVLEGAGAQSLEPRLVDLETGTFAEGDPDAFDPAAAEGDATQGRTLTPEQDIAGIGIRPNLARVLIVRDAAGDLALLVLPVYGRGYQSVIRANLVLQGDLNTIAALSIVEQAETPGLGARIQTPEWEALWPGRKIADEEGNLRIAVVRGAATNAYEVDGISGATRTSESVSNILRFWLGPNGFGPFLHALKSGDLRP